MKKPKLTPWFPADVKPVHEGIYEIYEDRAADRPTFKHWNGSLWGVASGSISNAFSVDFYGPSSMQKCRWRGLANPPKETKQKGEK